MRAAPALVLLGLAFAACSPGAPKGVDKAKLDGAVSDAIGDPATCVVIAELGTGKIVYRYNTATVCDRVLPTCDGAGVRKVKDLAEQVAKGGPPVMSSCNTTSDASRGVSWAAGPLPAKGLAYAAVMEGTRTFPGRMMAERLEPRFHDLGL